MLKKMVCTAAILASLASCAPLDRADEARLEAYQRAYQAKGASNAMTMQDMVDLGLARRTNLADPAFPPK